MILSLACDTILIISQEALFCYPHRFRLLHSPQHSWGIRLFIYNQESNYDTSYDNSQDYYEPDTSGDSSDPANSGDSSGSDQITYPSEDTGDGSGDTSGGDTSGGDAPAIPDYTETPGDGYEPSEDNNWDYVAPGADSGADGSDGSDSAQPDMEVYE